MIKHKKHLSGFTLLEMLLVVVIIAITASVALPDFSLGQHYKLETATRDLAQAVRFAREEAIRTKKSHGVNYESAQGLIKVYRLDTSTVPPTPVFDVYHPIDKTLYTLDYSANGKYAPISIYSSALLFGGNTTFRYQLQFDEFGVPNYYNAGAYEMLDSAQFSLTDGTAKMAVLISPMVGRVTMQ